MSANAPILVATRAVADAELVAQLLREEFDNVHLSTKPEQAVQDFEQTRPAVLILAFDRLEEAERYYLGLYRFSAAAPGIAHRTLILCNSGELWKVYELCRKSYFDDYVLFWPATNDAPRLRMVVHQLLRQIRETPGETVSAGQFAAQARQLVEGDTELERQAAAGNGHVELATGSLQQAQRGIAAALEQFADTMRRASDPDPAAGERMAQLVAALDALKAEALDTHLASVDASVRGMRDWLGGLAQQAASRHAAAQALQGLAERFKPLILMVDDDDLQQKLLQRALADVPMRLVFASTGMQALAMLRQMRPDLVLMDIELPDISGVETTRRLRRIPYLANVPVVMITGHSERGIVVECLSAGANDFAVKPFQKATLVAKIHAALAKAGATQ